MSRWWRAYDESVDDPKLIMLSDSQHRGWFNLLCVASMYGGALPDVRTIAIKLRMKEGRVEKLLAELRAAELIDDDGNSLRPHNWDARQYKSDVSTERVKRFRKRNRSVSETPPDTESDTDTEAERKETQRAQPRASPSQFDLFWERYPNKVGKDAARKAFEKIEKKQLVDISTLMAGLGRYAQKTDDRPWCNPATWLNQARWEDQPAAQIIGANNGRQRSSMASTADKLIAESAMRDGALDLGPEDYRDAGFDNREGRHR